MSDEFLGPRRRALEETFFAKENEKLRLALRRKMALEAAKESLAEVSGITDDAVLDRLLALRIGGDTLTALALVPLVEVAWADGHVDPREREAILAAADATGLARDGAGGQLLDGWLAHAPGPEMLAAWREYVEGVCADLSDDEKRTFKQELLGRARAVAEAAGGFLGLGNKVSASERAVLEDLARAFS